MEEQTCKYCIHYAQHYTLWGGKLHCVYCGHCILPRSSKKKLRPDTKACEQFKKSTAGACDLFASKEYLTKALLEKVLDMELLPEITAEKISL